MKNKLIFTIIGSGVFILFILLLMFLLGRKGSVQENANTSQNDTNRVPTKSLIQNTQNTAQVTPGPSPTDSPIDLDFSKRIDDDEQIDKSQLEQSPDVFLYNKLPYEESSFSMEGIFVEGGNGKINFTVTAKTNPSEARQAAISWMKSIGLTQANIDSFNIVYPQ